MRNSSVTVTVMGAGITGLVTALLLARDGHPVILLERDDFEVGLPGESPRWPRKGIPHFRQPHAFIPRGRAELKKHLPDVYATLLAAGAQDVDLRRKLPGSAAPEDADLCYLGVRRPVIEWALRQAVLAEPAICLRGGVQVQGLRVERGRVNAVRVDGVDVSVEVLVDALGRRSPTAGWLAEAGCAPPPAQTSDCGVVYYSRYYQVRPGFELPDGPWLLSPRGDLGYLGFATFPGDNGTFAALLAVPSGVPEWRVLKEVAPFEAAVAQIPMLRQWVDPDQVDPLTDVLAMAGLRNSYRCSGDGAERPIAGLFVAGDALCHTDPVLAHGLAFGIIHATELTAALAEHTDVGDAFDAYTHSTAPALRERYDLVTALDEQRRRMWVGGQVEFARRDGDYALFSMMAAAAAATVDPDVCRVFLRRIGLLDSTAVLDNDVGLQLRIEEIFRRIVARPRAPAGPERADLLALANAAQT